MVFQVSIVVSQIDTSERSANTGLFIFKDVPTFTHGFGDTALARAT
jgi:hypothetical protein